MIRLIALSFGTVTMIGAVLWGLDDRSGTDARELNEVSRSEPATLSLQPTLVQSGVVLNQPVATAPTPAPVIAALETEVAEIPPVRPVARPAQLRPAPVTPTPVIAPTPKASAPLPAAKDDAVRAMSYGIIGAFQEQGTAMTGQPMTAPQPTARIKALADEQTAAVTAPKVNVRTYTVKDGDSLPGIAFRFYGTTVAYLQILNANQDVLANPGDLTAGMTLRIPETN